MISDAKTAAHRVAQKAFAHLIMSDEDQGQYEAQLAAEINRWRDMGFEIERKDVDAIHRELLWRWQQQIMPH